MLLINQRENCEFENGKAEPICLLLVVRTVGGGWLPSPLPLLLPLVVMKKILSEIAGLLSE